MYVYVNLFLQKHSKSETCAANCSIRMISVSQLLMESVILQEVQAVVQAVCLLIHSNLTYSIHSCVTETIKRTSYQV